MLIKSDHTLYSTNYSMKTCKASSSISTVKVSHAWGLSLNQQEIAIEKEGLKVSARKSSQFMYVKMHHVNYQYAWRLQNLNSNEISYK